MSYVNKRERVFEDNTKPYGVRRARSESRMKQYSSATDLRTWCDDVEQRRQQILEQLIKSKGTGGPCMEEILPLESLLRALVAMKDDEIKDLEEELKHVKDAVNKAYEIKLTPEQQEKFDRLKEKLDKKYSDTCDDEDNK